MKYLGLKIVGLCCISPQQDKKNKNDLDLKMSRERYREMRQSLQMLPEFFTLRRSHTQLGSHTQTQTQRHRKTYSQENISTQYVYTHREIIEFLC